MVGPLNQPGAEASESGVDIVGDDWLADWEPESGVVQ
jgi:hypothetical protein